MCFIYSTDDRSLIAFETEAEAIAYAEGADVENGEWLFYAEDGKPLEPRFITPNETTRFTVLSGRYGLQPTLQGKHLRDVLNDVGTFAGVVRSREVVERMLNEGILRLYAYYGRENGMMIMGSTSALRTLGEQLLAASEQNPKSVIATPVTYGPYDDVADFTLSFHLPSAGTPDKSLLVKRRSMPLPVRLIVLVLCIVGAITLVRWVLALLR